MMCKSGRGMHFIYAILLIIFSLVETPASKWIIFAIGILTLLAAIFPRMCNCKECREEMPKKSKKKKKK